MTPLEPEYLDCSSFAVGRKELEYISISRSLPAARFVVPQTVMLS
jgi:hypothetical protein